MVNPVLTVLFDIAVIGGTFALLGMAIAEARASRRGVVASSAARKTVSPRVAARLAHRPSTRARGKAAA